MKFLSILVVFFSLRFVSAADTVRVVADPVADFNERHNDDFREKNEKNEHIIKIEIDANNDGKKDIFLSREKSRLYDNSQYENKVFMWDLYRKREDGRYDVIDSEKLKENGGEISKSQIDFDPDKFYVGYISEVKAFGVLAVYYLPKHNGVQLSAYVLRGDYFERLNFPSPSAAAKVYHRQGETSNIPDLPKSARQYLASPPIEKMVTLP